QVARLEELRKRRYFERPVFPLLHGFTDFNVDNLAVALDKYVSEIEILMRGGAKPGDYDPSNNFFKSPDAEILYLMVRKLTARRIVEVGSGNSTRIIRQAIADGNLSVEHVAIDPAPRSDITSLVNHMLLVPFECAETAPILARLGPGDILFIDSSHKVRVAND